MNIPIGKSPYVGGPSTRADEAWKELIGNISIRVTQEELDRNRNHNKSVPLPSGGGHLAWLGVFHQLHCLVSMLPSTLSCHYFTNGNIQKQLRRLNYREEYFPNMTDSQTEDLRVHMSMLLFETMFACLIC